MRTGPAALDPAGHEELTGLAEPERRYAVRDSARMLRATLVRTADKAIWWEGPDGRRGLGGAQVVDLPLYGSERLARVPLETAVLLAEGAKDCVAVWRAGLPCVGTVTGAASIPSRAVLEVLRDRIVVLWPDNDEPGYRHMDSIARALAGIAREIRWLQIPGLGPGAGAADVPTAEIPWLVSIYARVVLTRVGSDSTSLREKGQSPLSLQEPLTDSYARETGTKRYSRAELAELRAGVELRFEAPSDAALRELTDTLERIQGRLVRPSQAGYLIRCYRIHGPDTARLLTELFRERGGTENLLLALELAARAWPVEQVAASDPPLAQPPRPTGQREVDGSVEGWHCWADLGSGHVPALRPDVSVFCDTCHPGTAR